MGLENDLDDLLAIKKGHPRICSVQHVLSQLSDEQSEKVRTLIDAGVVPAPRIALVLSKNGFDITDKSITRHRRRLKGGGCSCP